MYPLKQSTAITVPFFVHDASGDAVTGLTDGSFTKRISKGSGAFAAMTVTITEMENGWYSIPLSTSHSDTLGLLTVVFTTAGAKQVNLQFRIHANLPDDIKTTADAVETDTQDIQGRLPSALVGGRVDANVGAISADATAADNLEADYDGTGYAKSASTIGTCTTNTDMRGTDNAALASVLGALADAAAAGDPTATDTVVAYVKQLINVLVGTAGVTTFPAEAAPANAVSLAEVLRAIHTDVTGLNGEAMRGTDGANTTTPPTAAAVADQVWDEAKSGHVTAGSFGEEVQAHALSTEVSALNDPTAATIADAVWDEAQSGHVVAGSFGEVATEIASILADTNELQTDDVPGLIAALNDPTAATVAAAVWNALQASHVTAGTFGEIATEVAAILADTNELQTDDVPALIAALNNLSAAQVNAEVLDVIATDTFAEPSSVPAATASLKDKIGWVAVLARNKLTQTSTTQTLRNDADAANIATATVSDDGTTGTRGEWV